MSPIRCLASLALALHGVVVLAGAYDQTAALTLSYLSKALYCGRHRFNTWDVGDSLVFGPRVDTSKLRFMAAWQTQGAAGVGRMTEPEGCFVVFRGTHGSTSSFLNLQAHNRPWGCKGCSVHWGFSQTYFSLSKKVFTALEDFGCNNEPIYVVGHSQGGAMVSYFVFDALGKGLRVKAAYALEPPRPGNSAFTKALQARVAEAGVEAYRVSHRRDIVVHLPPKSAFYVHSFPEIYYPDSNSLEYEDCGMENHKCANRNQRLTANDHMWFLNVNPCWCQNATDMTIENAATFEEQVPASCHAVLNNIAQDKMQQIYGNATCGWHIFKRALTSTISDAMAEVSTAFPEACGRCGQTVEEEIFGMTFGDSAEEKYEEMEFGSGILWLGGFLLTLGLALLCWRRRVRSRAGAAREAAVSSGSATAATRERDASEGARLLAGADDE